MGQVTQMAQAKMTYGDEGSVLFPRHGTPQTYKGNFSPGTQ